MTVWTEMERQVVQSMIKMPFLNKEKKWRPVFGNELDGNLLFILGWQRRLMPDIANLDVSEKRRQLKRMSRLLDDFGRPIGQCEDFSIPRPGGGFIPSRLYRPTRWRQPKSLMIFAHGGGWMSGDLDTHDGLCRFLAEETNMAVLAIDYRLAPEFPFPAGLDDLDASFSWVTEKASWFGIDPSRICLGGDSAGGNLSLALTHRIKRRWGQPPLMQLLLYPVTDLSRVYPSHSKYAENFFLTRRLMNRFIDFYLPAGNLRAHREVSPLLAVKDGQDVSTLIVTAGHDLLQDEGKAVHTALRKLGSTSRALHFPSLIHGFALATGAIPAANTAMHQVVNEMNKILY